MYTFALVLLGMALVAFNVYVYFDFKQDDDYMAMAQLVDHADYCAKGAIHTDGTQYVLIQHNGAKSRRKIQYKHFSNYSIEYVQWGGKRYQVNTVKQLYTENAQ